MQGAAKYIIEFTLPTGQTVTFEAIETSHTRYLESLTLGGEFFWKVTALNSKEEIICVSSQFTFTKPAPPPTSKQSHGNGENNNGDDNGTNNCPPGTIDDGLGGCTGNVG